MKTEQILLVLEIAHKCSLSKAAHSLNISQPAASNMLKSLEQEVGCPLFGRTRNGMKPTPEGLEFIKYAESIKKSLHEISKIHQATQQKSFHVVAMNFSIPELAFEKLCDTCISDSAAIHFSYKSIGSTEEAYRLAEHGAMDIAIVFCRKSLYESVSRNAEKNHWQTDLIGTLHLELTCSKTHPLLKNGQADFSLMGEYPCFSSMNISEAETYVSALFANHKTEIQNYIVMDPCDARYRLIQKKNGYLISIPLPDQIKTAYDFTSVVIEDSELAVFALYHNNPPKTDLIYEYIKNCRMMIDSLENHQ